MPIQLHIFEERYKLMINACIETQEPFGVVLIDSGMEAQGPLAETRLIGTTAYITQVQKLPNGRLNIVAYGRDRFRIQGLNRHDNPYLVGDVDFMPFTETDTSSIQQEYVHLRHLMKRYMASLQKLEQVQIEFSNLKLPDDPLSLGFLSAVLLQADNTVKQSLLEIEASETFISTLVELYKTEAVIMEVLMAPPNYTNSNLQFSPN